METQQQKTICRACPRGACYGDGYVEGVSADLAAESRTAQGQRAIVERALEALAGCATAPPQHWAALAVHHQDSTWLTLARKALRAWGWAHREQTIVGGGHGHSSDSYLYGWSPLPDSWACRAAENLWADSRWILYPGEVTSRFCPRLRALRCADMAPRIVRVCAETVRAVPVLTVAPAQ